jgi:proline iminopeptidase
MTGIYPEIAPYQHAMLDVGDGNLIGVLLRNAHTLANIPGVLVNGRYDLQAPIAWAYDLKRAWPRAELVIVDNAGHDPSNAGVTEQLIRATNLFA